MSDRVRMGLTGVVSGAVLTLLGIALAPDAAPLDIPATTTTLAAESLEPYWHDPHETIIGPAAFVPISLVAEDGVATLIYRVESITPAVEGPVLEEDAGPPVGIEVIVLETGSRRIEGRAARIGSTEVRFDVGPGFEPADLDGLVVERFWLRMPHSSDVDLPAVRGAEFQIDDHVTVAVEAVVSQSTGTIVNLDTTRRSNEFISARNPIVWITGRGSGWESSVRSSGAGIGGSTGIQLTYDGDELPDPMPLTVSADQWVPVERTIDVDIGGLTR